jgi:hypothetical protein
MSETLRLIPVIERPAELAITPEKVVEEPEVLRVDP